MRRGTIEPEEAVRNSLARVRQQWLVGNDELRAAAGGRPAEGPITVNDLDGESLFYEYEVADEEGVVATVRASANEAIGMSLLSVQLGGRGWSPSEAVRHAEAYASQAYDAKPIRSELVCFSYPKVGVRVVLDIPGRGEASVIIDVADGLPINNFGPDEPEGVTAYSYYRELVEPTGDARARRWAREAEERETLYRVAPQLVEESFSADVSMREVLVPTFLERSAYLARALSTQKVIRYGPRCSPHECFQLYAQETDVYCAVATGQMILDFYRWNYTQAEIAAAMNTGASGTDNPEQVAGYNALSRNTLVATFDGTAAWSEAKAEIDANRPVKSGIPGHARAVAGWMRTLSGIFIGGGAFYDRSLKVYDPWPWNADSCAGGAIVWEDWDAVEHTNWITVRHRTTNCG
ncbi:MAG: C39 family peptidase [Acidimicrobiales bacterium]